MNSVLDMCKCTYKVGSRIFYAEGESSLHNLSTTYMHVFKGSQFDKVLFSPNLLSLMIDDSGKWFFNVNRRKT